jgi:two-component system chemotaxis response regulator CheB
MTEYKVLIVDDSPFMRKVFSDVVDADAAFNVLATAANGKEAIDLALRLKPDIITMDLEMPYMNGIEALQRIMKVQPTPVIMLSAVTDNGTRDTIRALQYGAIDFIRKPDGAVKLDIHQVGEQLLEKLHIALETMSGRAFRMLPAVEEKELSPPLVTPIEIVKPIPLSPAPIESPTRFSSKELEKRIEQTLETKTELARKPEGLASQRKPIERSSLTAGLMKSKLTQSEEAVIPAVLKPEIKPDLVKPQSETSIKRITRTTIHLDKPAEPTVLPPAGNASTVFTHLVAIGTSTGGPRALHEVLTGIPADFPAPILIVQHMPPKFTHSLAQRLDNFSSIRVREAVDGELVETATAYIAPGGRHMTIGKDAKGRLKILLSDENPRGGHRPSVDVLFESLIGHHHLKRHIVLMTGMGSDGAKGMKALQTDGAVTTIAEAEQTCVVYGMPRSAVELGAASHLLPLQSIAPLLVQEVKSRKP